jgi:Zn-dependent metalloprotease
VLPANGAVVAGLAAQATPPSAQAAPGSQAVGVGNSLYSGIVRLNTTANGTGYQLLDTTRGKNGVLGGNAVTDMEHTLADPKMVPGTVYANPTNDWGNGTLPPKMSSTTSPAGQSIAVDAAYGLQSAWDYYAQVHKRNGIDGNGTQLFVRVNAGGYINKFDNAYWSGNR